MPSQEATGRDQRLAAAPTIQRLLQRVDPDALDEALPSRAAPRATGTVIAIDGKELRSAKRGGRDRVHLMSALDYDTVAVLAQIDAHAKTNEIPRLPVLLQELDGHRSLKGRIFTIDALHTQIQTARLICNTYRAHYLMTIKGNQPGLYSPAESQPWNQVPVSDIQEDTSHGRLVRRELKSVTPTGVLASAWPGAREIGQLNRTAVRAKGKGKEPTVEVVYLITSFNAHQGPAKRINEIVRGHWVIAALHYVRDVTFARRRQRDLPRQHPTHTRIIHQRGHYCTPAGQENQHRRVHPGQPRGQHATPRLPKVRGGSQINYASALRARIPERLMD